MINAVYRMFSSVFLLFLLFLDTLYFYRHLFIFLRVHQERSAIVYYGFVVTCFLIGKHNSQKFSGIFWRIFSRKIIPENFTSLLITPHPFNVSDKSVVLPPGLTLKILRFGYNTFTCFAWILEQLEIITQ